MGTNCQRLLFQHCKRIDLAALETLMVGLSEGLLVVVELEPRNRLC